MRIRFGFGRLDDNHHTMTRVGWKRCTSCDGVGEIYGDRCYGCFGRRVTALYQYRTRCSTWSFVALGRDSWLAAVGRTYIGLRLWIYGRNGACINFDVRAEVQAVALPHWSPIRTA
jgi:hypothetical protein